MKKYTMLLTMGIFCMVNGSEQRIQRACFLSVQSPYDEWWKHFKQYWSRRGSKWLRESSLALMDRIVSNNPKILLHKHPIVRRYPLEVLAIIAHEIGEESSAEYKLLRKAVRIDTNNRRRRYVVQWGIICNNSVLTYIMLRNGTDISTDPKIMIKAVNACNRLHNKKECRKTRDKRYELWAIIDMLLTSRANLSSVIPMMEYLSQARCNGIACTGCQNILAACRSSLLYTTPRSSLRNMRSAGQATVNT